jgi:hypothetical protein
LGLDRHALRVITTDLAGPTTFARKTIRRDSITPLLAMERPDRIVLLPDSDEFLDEAAVLHYAEQGVGQPTRLGLVPLYGAIDREALSIHRCWPGGRKDLRFLDPRGRGTGWVFGRTPIGCAAALVTATPSRARFSENVVSRVNTFGVRITYGEPAERLSRIIEMGRHRWNPRVYQPLHLQTLLGHGVHHAGW